MRRSKTSLLKFPNIYMPQLYITFFVQYRFLVLIAVGVLICHLFSKNLIKQCALWISYELVLTADAFVVKMSDINSTKCSLASVISLVFLCSVCSAISYLSFIFCFFLNFLKQYLSARNLLWSNDQKTLVFSVGFQERAHCLNVNQGNQTCLDP